jgi:putative glutamine amidotransferase
VVRARGVPLLIPLVGDTTVLRCLYDQCAGLLLSGGNDVDPALYHAAPLPRTSNICPARDTQELQLLAWALADDKPILGICRGMQLINVALGGSLHQDVAADVPAARDHQSSEHHENFHHIAHHLRIDPASRLAAIIGTRAIDTNALHHQAVNKLGKGLVVTARAEDGVIEALELPGKRFVIGVQSHPEALEATAEPRWQRLFKAFVDGSSAV